MRILILDDRQVDRRIAEHTAEDFGEVREAADLDQARAMIAGWQPSVVLADLHMAGRDPLDHFAAVMALIDEQRTKLVAVTGDLGDQVLVRRFHQRFPSTRLIAKDVREIREALASIRVDESGRAVSTMDQGTVASREQIRVVVDEWAAERLLELGVSWFDLRVWADRIRELGGLGFGWAELRRTVEDRLRCLSTRERLVWSVGVSVLTLASGTVLLFVASAAWRAVLMGPQ